MLLRSPIPGRACQLTRIEILCIVVWYVCLITVIPLAQQWEFSSSLLTQSSGEVVRCVGMACSTNTNEPCCCMPGPGEATEAPTLQRMTVISGCSNGESVLAHVVRMPWAEDGGIFKSLFVDAGAHYSFGGSLLEASSGLPRRIDKVPILGFVIERM